MAPRTETLSRPVRMTLVAIGLCLLGSLGVSSVAEARVGTTFSKRLLVIQGTAKAESIIVGCNENAKVVINGRVPKLLAGGPLPCERVAEIDVISGAGSDRIDLTDVGADFASAKFAGFGTGRLTAIVPGAGRDRVSCGDAFCFVPDAGPGEDLLRGGPRRDILRGGGDNDRVFGSGGRDDLLGRGGNDYLEGGDGNDLMSGNGGDDRLYGEFGDDLIGGGAGSDLLSGGPDDDRLLGGPGKDKIMGGAGKNTIVQDPPRSKRY